MSGREHISVLFQEVLNNLISTESGTFVDATVGAAGHSLGLLGRNRKLHLIGIDRDQEALDRAREALAAYSDRVTLLRGNFGDMKELLQSVGVKSIEGALFDLGISSYQLASGRGFSFNDDEELDMRMDRRQDLTAYDIVNSYRQDVIARILYEYGEEWQSRRIAKAIFEHRKKDRIRTGRQLAEIIASVKKRTGKIHPATKTFQALRIAVNDELRSLVKGMDGAIELLSSGSRIGIITFHSLEDRIVKERFRNEEALTVLTRKPIRPGIDEVRSNPRSRSAKLRIAQKN
ncbi:MAG: 16S rRNA (cytosine(1402)-N(4))-methyltransferase RsmH [Syntrophorhabdaceae bacterium]|nr:16S rRNA (cytosine(1402)-N(4))-methyltransferase RsmH [Syntrophorhabdaceae bacterium]MDD4196562.1 16S rRNA (cytosine(1402)-N(4))-methyltransferase RsmH [Syntrophorhabdaceae bacterium]